MNKRIIPSARSRGIRIPKPLLDEAGLSGDVEISDQRDDLLI